METSSPNLWRKCSSCKKDINFNTNYYACSVSTCNGQRTGYVFCSVACFERHLPGARHKDAGAVEKRSPTSAVASTENTSIASRTLVRPTQSIASTSVQPPFKQTSLPKETLVIASRLKEYVQAKADFNTSAAVMDVLSDQLRLLCDRAIDSAKAEGRKTILDRDFAFLKKYTL